MNRHLILLLAAILLLAGCSEPENGGGTPNPEPSLPTGQALVLGEANSTVLDALDDFTSLTPHDGTQDLADYDMLIFDGDHYGPEEVRDHETVKQAVRSGMWVLGLDLSAEHKRVGLGDLVHAASGGKSPGYAVQLRHQNDGSPEVNILEYTSSPTVIKLDEDALGISLPSPQAIRYGHSFKDVLLERLNISPMQADTSADDSEGLQKLTVNITQPFDWALGDAGRKSGSQQASYQATYTFTIYLQNETDPVGDYQWIDATASISANPTNGTNQFLNMDATAGSDWVSGTYVEMAWFQTQTAISMTPDASWTLSHWVPPTVNLNNTVTHSYNFTVGFNQADGFNGSFGVSTSVTNNVPNWKVDDTSSGVRASWLFSSDFPLDATQSFDCFEEAQEAFFDTSCYIKAKPNDQSLYTMSGNTTATWYTPQLVDDWTVITLQSEHHMVDIYCYKDFGFGCLKEGGAKGTSDQKGVASATTDFSIDLGAVIPVTIASISYNQNPVSVGASNTATVEGTITFAEPLPIDTYVYFLSDSANAAVVPVNPPSLVSDSAPLTPVFVTAGTTSQTFQIDVNANNLEPGGKTTANITTYYGGEYLEPLTIINNP